jgi:hypothetical protein
MRFLFVVGAMALAPLNVPAQTTDKSASVLKPKAAVTQQDVEHFMTVAFGDFAAQGGRRLAAWRDSAAVRLQREVKDEDRKLLDSVIAEINTHAGRTIYFLTEAIPEVELNMVSSDIFSSVVQRNAKTSQSAIRSFRVSRTGNIAGASIFVRSDDSRDAKLHAFRLHLAKCMGMMALSMDGRRSIFAGTRSSKGYEPVDRIAIRLMAAHAHLAGASADEVRKVLNAEFPAGK